MTRDEFMSKALASGKSKEEIKKVYDSIAAAGEFDEPEKTIAEKPETQPQSENIYGATGTLFPRSVKAEENKAGIGSRVLSGAADVLSLPQRAISGIATGAGYLAGGGNLREAAKEAAQDIGKYKTEEKGLKGFAQEMAYDPTLLVPGLGLTKLGKPLLQSGKTLGRVAKSAGVMAGQGGASAALQSASGEKDIDKGAILGTSALSGALPFAGAGLAKAGIGLVKSLPSMPSKLSESLRSGISKTLAGAAKRNINVEMKQGQRGANLGFDPENALKHDLVGSVREVVDKSQAKLNDLQNKANQIAKDSDAKFNVPQIFKAIKEGFKRKDNPEEYDDMVNLVDNLNKIYTNTFGEVVDAPTAMKIRTLIGKNTNFIGNRAGKGFTTPPNPEWKDKVYNSIYGTLKDEIHNNVGEELKAINKAQSEIIPISEVAKRRLPISESNLPIGLMDVLAFTGGATAMAAPGDAGERARNSILGGIGLSLARRGAGSATATRALYNLSKSIAPKEGKKAAMALEELAKKKRKR